MGVWRPPLGRAKRAVSWSESYGALGLDDAPLSRVLPLAVAADAEADLKKPASNTCTCSARRRGEAGDDSDLDLFFDYEKGKLVARVLENVAFF